MSDTLDRLELEALGWRRWATGERKNPPHNLLAFTTDVSLLVAVARAAETLVAHYLSHKTDEHYYALDAALAALDAPKETP